MPTITTMYCYSWLPFFKWIQFRASFIRFRSDKSEHTPTDPLVWRRNVSGAFLMIVFLNQASGAKKVTDHVRCVWLEKLYMDQLHNTTTAVGTDGVDRCNLLGYRFITAAVIIHFALLFSFPFHLLWCSHYSRPPNAVVYLRSGAI